jgi:hypothetical protein
MHSPIIRLLATIWHGFHSCVAAIAAPAVASTAAFASAVSAFGGCPPSPVICTRAEVGRACNGEEIARGKESEGERTRLRLKGRRRRREQKEKKEKKKLLQFAAPRKPHESAVLSSFRFQRR